MAPIPRGLRDLVGQAARAIGRSQGDADPFAQILSDNWFDNAESLSNCRPEELVALGIPLRFAQQIVNVASSGAKPSAAPTARGGRVGGGGGGGDGGGGGGWRGGGDGRRELPAHPQADSRRGGRGGGGGGGGDGGAERGRVRTLKVKVLEPKFGARGSVLGPKGRNVHHIQDETSVKVDLRGESDETMELVFSDAPNNQAMDMAFKMGKDLLRSVYTQHDEWLQAGGGKGGGGGGGGAGGGGGKGGRERLPSMENSEFKHQIEIQECDEAFAVRAKLIGRKGANMKDIEGPSGARVQLRGEPGETMRLELGASSPEQLAKATDLAEELVAKVYAEYDQWLESGGNTGGGDAGEQAEDKPREGTKRKMEEPEPRDFVDTVEVDIPDVDPRFKIRREILGKGGTKLNEIQKETKAKVNMSKNSEGPIKLEIAATTPESLDLAMTACQEIVQGVFDAYARFQAEADDPHALAEDAGDTPGDTPSKGKGRSGGKGRDREREPKGAGKGRDREPKGGKGRDREPKGGAAKGGAAKGAAAKGAGGAGKVAGAMKKVLKLKDCDPDFNLGGKLRGSKCENLHHIQDETGAMLWVLGEAGEPVRLEISANAQAPLDQAAQMSKDLIKTIFHEYEQWKNGPPAKRQRA